MKGKGQKVLRSNSILQLEYCAQIHLYVRLSGIKLEELLQIESRAVLRVFLRTEPSTFRNRYASPFASSCHYKENLT